MAALFILSNWNYLRLLASPPAICLNTFAHTTAAIASPIARVPMRLAPASFAL